MKQRAIKLGATAFALVFAAFGVLTVTGLDRLGQWNEYTVIAFTAGIFAASGGWMLSQLLWEHYRGDASV